MSYKTTIANTRVGESTTNILYSKRGSIVASSTTSGNAFNVADQNPNTKWKAGAGTQDIRIDLGANTPVVYVWFKSSSDDLTTADTSSLTVQASATGAFAGEEVEVLNTTTELGTSLSFKRYVLKLRVGAPLRHFRMNLTPTTGRNAGLIEWGMSYYHPDVSTSLSVDLETNEIIERPLDQAANSFDGIPTGNIDGISSPIRTSTVIIGGTITNYTTNSNLNDRFDVGGWVSQTADSVSIRNSYGCYNNGLNIRYGGFIDPAVIQQIKSWDIFSFRTHGNIGTAIMGMGVGAVNGYSYATAGAVSTTNSTNASVYHIPLGDSCGTNVSLPDARESHGCFEFSDSIVISPGFYKHPDVSPVSPRPTFYRFSASQVWEARTSLNKASYNVASVGRKGVLVGGQETAGILPLLSNAQEYDTDGDYYLTITSAPWGASRLGSCVPMYNRIHLISFGDGSGPLSQHNYYEPASRSYVGVTVQPTPRIATQHSSF